MNKMLWYLAHAYISEPDVNFRLTNIIAGDLIDRGYFIFSPVSMTHPIDLILKKQEINKPNEFWYEFDFITAKRCDGLILSGYWRKSKGCMAELEFFQTQNKPVLVYRGVGMKLEYYE